MNVCDDEGTKKTLHHLLTREITPAQMFMMALDQMVSLKTRTLVIVLLTTP